MTFHEDLVFRLMYFRVVSQDLRHCCLFRFFNKVGTYHNTSHNEVWRKPLLEAAIHKDCIDPPDKSCNVCGLQFFPTWAHFMPGNFWTAQCSYINKLLHPVEYRYVKEPLTKRFLQLRDQNLMDICLFQDVSDIRGVGRYAAGTQLN